LLKDDEKTAAIEIDYSEAPLSHRERAICDYAAKLTHEPHVMEKADVEALRAAGLGDGEILDACQVAAYYAYVNRMAEGLGVELEAYWDLLDERRRPSPG